MLPVRSLPFACSVCGGSMETAYLRAIEFTDQRVEAVGRTCPIIEAAERLEVADKIQDVSLC